jgi:alpha-1,6-mannosyltransferase
MDRIVHNDQTLWAGENSPCALADAIRSAIEARLKSDPATLHARVAAQYSWRQVFARLFDLYHSVVSNYSRSGRHLS